MEGLDARESRVPATLRVAAVEASNVTDALALMATSVREPCYAGKRSALARRCARLSGNSASSASALGSHKRPKQRYGTYEGNQE